MAIFINEKDVSTAWAAAFDALVTRGGDVVNLTVAIADPTAEHEGVRQVLDRFINERRRAKGDAKRVSAVANTLFPYTWYLPERLDPDAAEHLYELERVAGHSHLSFSLLHGGVSLLAVYRSQDFISRAYENYLGLGRVLQFVAHESGFPAGELTCVSASAAAEINRGGSFGHEQVEALPDDCEAALRMSP